MGKRGSVRPQTKTITADDFGQGRIAEFWSKVSYIAHDGCMVFQGAERVKGYGCVEMRGRTSRTHRRALAHRAAYAMIWGICPGDKMVLHTCDNMRCVNPAHLVLGTQQENIADMIKKGRSRFYGRPPSMAA